MKKMCSATHQWLPSLPSSLPPSLAQVLTSREFKVAGAIGPCSSLKKMAPNVAETAIGEGGKAEGKEGGREGGRAGGWFLMVFSVDEIIFTLSPSLPPSLPA